MASSPAVLCNKALAHLGVVGGITTLSSDTTAAGGYCRTFYDGAVLETLKAAPWSCAKKVATLTLHETLTASRDEEWTYAYRLPEDSILPRRIRLYGNRTPGPNQEVPFELFADTDSTAWSAVTAYAANNYASLTTGATVVWYRCILATTNNTPPNATYWTAITGGPPKLLHCDIDDAVLEYTMLLSDPTRFDGDLESAIAARLAYDIAPGVTKSDATAIRGQVAGVYNALMSAAIAADARSRVADVAPPSGWELARYRAGRR